MAAMKQDQHQHQKQRKQRPQNLNMQDQQAEEIKQRMEAKRCHNKTSVTTTTTAKKEPSSTTAPNKGAILFAQASQQAELHQKAADDNDDDWTRSAEVGAGAGAGAGTESDQQQDATRRRGNKEENEEVGDSSKQHAPVIDERPNKSSKSSSDQDDAFGQLFSADNFSDTLKITKAAKAAAAAEADDKQQQDGSFVRRRMQDNETTSKPPPLFTSHHHPLHDWSNKNVTSADAAANNRLLTTSSESRQQDSINGSSSSSNNRTSFDVDLPITVGTDGNQVSDELIGVHNYLQFGGGGGSESSASTEQPTIVLPPTRNLNASLEAQAKLRQAMNQLHYNKTLSFERMNTSEFRSSPAEDRASLLPAGHDQQQQQQSSLLQTAENLQQQFVSVSPTQEPSSRVEWMPKEEGPVSGQTTSFLGGGDLQEAAGEIHQHRRQQQQQHETSSVDVGDWGRRKSAGKSAPVNSSYSPDSDLVSWTPAAGPAAYKAGSSGVSDFTVPTTTTTTTTNTSNGALSVGAVEYSEQSESRHSFETRSRPDFDATSLPENNNNNNHNNSKSTRRKPLSGSRRLTKIVKAAGENRHQQSLDADQPARNISHNKQRPRTPIKQQASRPVVELPKAPPPDPDLEEDTDEEPAKTDDSEPASSEHLEESDLRAPVAKIQPARPASKPERKPAKRRPTNLPARASTADSRPVADASDIPRQPSEEETTSEEDVGEHPDQEQEPDDEGARKGNKQQQQQQHSLRRPKIRQKHHKQQSSKNQQVSDKQEPPIKWSPQTSFVGDDEPPTKRAESHQQEASLVVGSKVPDEQQQQQQQPDEENESEDDADADTDNYSTEQSKPSERPISKDRRFVGSEAKKPPVIRTFRMETSPQPRVEFSSPQIPAPELQQEMQQKQQTIGGFSPQSSLPATLVAGRPAAIQRPNFIHQQNFAPVAMRPSPQQQQFAGNFHVRPPQSAPMMTQVEPFNEAQASSQHQQERFYTYSPIMPGFQAQPQHQQQQQHVYRPFQSNNQANNENQQRNQNHQQMQIQNNSAWSIVTFPYPQQQQQQQQQQRQQPFQSLASSQQYFNEFPQATHETGRRIPAPIQQQFAGGAASSSGQLEQRPTIIYQMPAPQLDSPAPTMSSGYSPSAASSLQLMSPQPESQFMQHQLMPARPQQQQQHPLLIQRGARQAPMSSAPPLTIRLDTRNEPSSPQQQQQRQRQQPPATDLVELSQFPAPLREKIPPSNAHLPPQAPRDHNHDQLPMMRRPMSSSSFYDQPAESAPHLSSRTNGHAYAGQLKLPQMSVTPSSWLHQPHQPSESSIIGDEEFVSSAHFGALGNAAGDEYVLSETAASFFPMHSSMFDPNQMHQQQLAVAAAMPASVFMAPTNQPAGPEAGGRASSNRSPAAQSQFVKKGVTPISAALPLATPARVRDAFGWPMGYGSENAKSLLKVNHVAPPPAYLIPDKVSEAQTSALLQPTMIEPGSGMGKPPRVSPLQEDPSIIQQPAPKGSGQSPWTMGAQQHSMLGQHSMLRPQVVWPGAAQIRPQQQAPAANVLRVVLSTRPPQAQPQSRRAKLWQRLRSPFGRNREGSSTNRNDSISSRARFKRGILDQAVTRLVGSLGRSKPSDLNSSSSQTQKSSSSSQQQQTKLALIELGSGESNKQQAFIPLIDMAGGGGLLESDVLSQALAYNNLGQPPAPSRPEDPMMMSQSGLVSSFSSPQSPQSPQSDELYQQQQQLRLQPAFPDQQHFYVPASLEPPANEPPGKLINSTKKPTGFRQWSISRSLSRPLSRLKSFGTRWFPGSGSNSTGQQQQHKANNRQPSQNLLASSSSQVQPTALQMSVAQQLSSMVSPSVMMSHQANSLDNFNRFAIPIHQFLLQQKQQQQQQQQQHQQQQLLPLANHASQSMSPFSFVLDKSRRRPTASTTNHSLVNPMAAASTLNNRLVSWHEPPMMMGSQQSAPIGANLRRSEYDQYPPIASSHQQQQQQQQQHQHQPRQLQQPSFAAQNNRAHSAASVYSAHRASIVSKPSPIAVGSRAPQLLRYQPARMRQDHPVGLANNRTQYQPAFAAQHRPTKLILREPVMKQPLQQQQQQQPQEMFAEFSSNQLDSLAQATDFTQEPMMQSLMSSASNSIQAEQLPKSPAALAESAGSVQTMGAEFSLAPPEQQDPFQQPAAAAFPQQPNYFHQQAPYGVGMNQAGGGGGGGFAQSRPRLPKLLPSINSMANKFRQHLYQTFRLNSSPLLAINPSMVGQRPPTFDSGGYISPSYVSYPQNQFHQLQQQQQQHSIAPTNYLSQATFPPSNTNFAPANSNFAHQHYNSQFQRPTIQQQQQASDANSIPSGEHEIVYESPVQPAEFQSTSNATQIIQIQPEAAEPGQVIEMYEQVMVDPQAPNSIQQVQQQQQQQQRQQQQHQQQQQQTNGTTIQYEQAQRDETSSPEANNDVNLITSDGTYIQEDTNSAPSSASRDEPAQTQTGGRVNIEDLRSKTNITVHHHHVIEEDHQQQEESSAPMQAQDEQQQDEQQQQQEIRPINGMVIETTRQQQQQYEPERIQVRQPPRSVQLVQVGGRKVPASGQKNNSRFVNRHNSTSSASMERADYQIIRASPTTLSQQQSRSTHASTVPSIALDQDDREQPSVFVKLINGTVIEPISEAPSTATLDAAGEMLDANSIQQHQTTYASQTTTPAESTESADQQQAGATMSYESNHDDQTNQTQQRPVPIYEGRTNRTLLEYGLAPVKNTTHDDYMTSTNDVYDNQSDIARSHNNSQPPGTANSSKTPSTKTRYTTNETWLHDDHYVLVDQPVILTRQQVVELPPPPPAAASNNQTNYEPPMVFVSAKPERVIKELPFKGDSHELNRKRPLKRPKSGQTKLRPPQKPATTAAAAALAVASSEVDSEKATELSASHSSAQYEPTHNTGGARDYKTTTSSPAAQTPRARNHNFRSSSTTTTTTTTHEPIWTTTERPRPLSQANFTRAPKSRIRWQGANGRLSASKSASTSAPTSLTSLNQTELSSSETSRREQAWIVSSMTHQAYANQPPTGLAQPIAANLSAYSSRTNPIELVTLAPPNGGGVANHQSRKQQNSSSLSEPHSSSHNNMTTTTTIIGDLNSAFFNGSHPVVEQQSRQSNSSISQRIYANLGLQANTNTNANTSKRHIAEPRGRFQTFKSSSPSRSKASRTSDWSISTTLAPASIGTDSTYSTDSDSNSNSNSNQWVKSRESRTAPTSFRLSAASIVATSQQPAQQAAPMDGAPAATTPLSYLNPNRTASEFSARSNIDRLENDAGLADEEEDLTLDSSNSASKNSDIVTEATTTTITTTTSTTTTRPASLEDPMAWLMASLDDTREDRLVSSSLSSIRQPQSDLAQQQQQQQQTAPHPPPIDDAGLQIKIAPGGSSAASELASDMISFSQLRHTND